MLYNEIINTATYIPISNRLCINRFHGGRMAMIIQPRVDVVNSTIYVVYCDYKSFFYRRFTVQPFRDPQLYR